MTVSVRELANALLARPQLGATTDYVLLRQMEASTPSSLNAWTHVVPTLAKYAKRRGKTTLLGRDKGEKIYQELVKQLRLVPLGLYGDRLLDRGATGDECLFALVRTLVDFKEVFPNWMDAYSTAYELFVEQSAIVVPILEKHQRSIESELDWL